ncbi:MAG: thioredoxin domain-containing protein [Acidobacteriota bacterium]
MTRPPNRLIHAKSPYLRQHAYNPVDWYPWGPEALETARRLDRPILLSIGYSACHWCHVMERESFEDPDTARLMNELFVNVKVDREERPDLDQVYMNFVQLTTGSGGWPLTVFLTPDLVPFFGGTYFPPRDLPGRPSFRAVLTAVSRYFREHREEIEKRRDQVLEALQQVSLRAGNIPVPGPECLAQAEDRLLRRVDWREGGFGGAPKFPMPAALEFLQRRSAGIKAGRPLEAVGLTLWKMARGGIRDHLGGGFHRYAVDAAWRIPHFEKMLYDNAQLIRTYLAGWLLAGEEEFRRVAEETIAYLLRDLRHPGGAFFSSEDADSEGEEGAFYVWSKTGIENVLGESEARLFCEAYGVSELGNWEGVNILYLRRTPEELAREAGGAPEEYRRFLDEARRELARARSERVRPARDEKILAGWNGLAVLALAEAGFLLGEPGYLEAAKAAAGFLRERLAQGDGLGRSWCDGEVTAPGCLDDYAYLAAALRTLWRLSGEDEWLEWSVALVAAAERRFADPAAGDFFYADRDRTDLLYRPKEYVDHATPSANAVMAENYLALAELTGKHEWRLRAEAMVAAVGRALQEYPEALASWLNVLDAWHAPLQVARVVGDGPAVSTLVRELASRYLPNTLVVLGGVVGSPGTAWPAGVGASEEGVYVCRGQSCLPPARSPRELAERLGW